MNISMRRSERAGGRRERGAVLVELAMVTPILIVLVMGIVDFGMMFSERISMRGGVREASWNASRGMLGSADGCTLTFAGPAPSAATQRVMGLAKDRSELPEANYRVKVRLVDLDNASLAGTGAVGQGIMVCAMRPARSTTRFFAGLLDNRVQEGRLTNVIIVTDPANPITPGEEQPLPGRDWSWCNPAVAAPS
jgi:hypothetical protein